MGGGEVIIEMNETGKLKEVMEKFKVYMYNTTIKMVVQLAIKYLLHTVTLTLNWHQMGNSLKLVLGNPFSFFS